MRTNTSLAIVILLLAGHALPNAMAGPELTEQAAVELAWKKNPRLAAARHGRDAALVDANRDKPVARPTLAVQAEGRVQGPRVMFPRAGADDATVLPETFYRLQLELDQTVYRPGLGAAWTRYAATRQIAELQVLRTANEVARDVRKAFHAVLLAEAMQEVAEEGMKLAAAQLDQTRKMLEEGLVPPRDLTAGEADLAEAEQGLIRARNGLALARADLARLTDDSEVAERRLANTSALRGVNSGLAELEQRAMKLRPELLQIRAGIEAARAGLSLARIQQHPVLSARAVLARQTGSAFERSAYAAAGLMVTWNLMDGGKARMDAAEAAHRVAELEAQEQEARSGIRLEVQKAWRDAHDARSRLGAAERQMAAALRTLEIARARYEERTAIQLEVSGALFGLVRARSNVAQAEHDLRVAQVDLRYAVGEDVPQSGPSESATGGPRR